MIDDMAFNEVAVDTSAKIFISSHWIACALVLVGRARDTPRSRRADAHAAARPRAEGRRARRTRPPP